MYEGDSPLAERRAAALSLDAGLLAELLGRAELRELLDPAVIERVENELQRLAPERRLRGVEGVADLLRLLGPLTVEEVAARLQSERLQSETASRAPEAGTDTEADLPTAPPAADVTTASTHLAALVDAKRALAVSIAGVPRFAAIEDASRLRDALGVPLPIGVPVAFIEPVDDPLGDLVSRYARTHGPFVTSDVAARLGLGPAIVHDALRRLAHDGRVVEGEFRPHAHGSEWSDAEVLRRLRRMSLAALRHEVEPVDTTTFARFLPDWQHVGGTLRGVDAVASVIEQLAGARIPASAWESLVLPSRVADYSPAMLDELTATGEVIWAGDGTLPGNDGWVSLNLADSAPLTLAPPGDHDTDELQRSILDALSRGGGYFFRQLSDALGSAAGTAIDDDALVTALWDLVWAGLITNDTLAPLRTLTGSSGAHKRPRQAPRSRLYRGRAATRSAMVTRMGPPTVAGRWSLLPRARSRVDRPRPRAGRDAARPLRRRHPWVGHERGLPRRIRPRLQGAQRLRRDGPGTARLLRRDPRRRPVRHRRDRGPAAVVRAGPHPARRRTRRSRSRRPTPRIPTERHCPGRSRRRMRAPVTAPAARRAPSSCWWTERSPSTWSAGARASSASPTRRTTRRATICGRPRGRWLR